MSQPIVTLFGQGIGKKQFPLDWAQRIISSPITPKVWSLDDPLYRLTDGIIELIPNTGDNQMPQE